LDEATLQQVIDEILPVLLNCTIGKIFQLGRNQLVIDFRPGDGRYLLLNFEPSLTPRMYLVRRRVRDLERQSENASNFVQFVRKRLSTAKLNNVFKNEHDRIVNFVFLAETDDNQTDIYALVAQLTGRTANLFLLDASGVILASLRESHILGQVYTPPERHSDRLHRHGDSESEAFKSKFSALPLSDRAQSHDNPPSPLSNKLDQYFSKLEKDIEFETDAKNANNKIRQELTKKEKLLQRLEFDLTRHGEPEQLKKTGDLLLANAVTARRMGNQVYVIDYFDENAPEIMIETDENLTLPEAAEKFFTRYAKARNAAVELTERIANLKREIPALKDKLDTLEAITGAGDKIRLQDFVQQNGLSKPQPEIGPKPASKKEPEITSGIRRYRSSDGLEILVGRNSKDNDYLTMRVAKSLDWWLHAADYGGSHVVVRNPSKGELPSKTLLEAAQLAAKFSQARADSKVAVNYTQRKFVNKPKNAPLGLVRLASFRTILVEPKEAGERILK
jgi:predicted ribosome quality control (RQC) complex YloA/Tae2 family protein